MAIYEQLQKARELKDRGLSDVDILEQFIGEPEVYDVVKVFLTMLGDSPSKRVEMDRKNQLRAIIVRFGESVEELKHHLTYVQPLAFKNFAPIVAYDPEELFMELKRYAKELYDSL